jgi:hypothetical protein
MNDSQYSEDDNESLYTQMLQPPRMAEPLPFPDTVWTALFLNGQLLGNSCHNPTPRRSHPAPDDLPVPLRPTPTQLTTVHFPGVDQFPFPVFRDNYILLDSFVDEEAFLADLFTMPSFTIRAGCASWDPRAWVVARPFAEKWGYLFRPLDLGT